MKTLKLLLPKMVGARDRIVPLLILTMAILLWQNLPLLLRTINPAVGLVDAGIWQLLLFSIISYLLFLLMSVGLFHWFLTQLAIPTLNTMVLQVKNLQLWQQFVLYWASFALLFLGSFLSLAAIF